ncbi:hypothetical protein HAPAU_33530 [Halalkalicoccus paucihalophilus]|uniref:Uncharacterized protein n=1 Tax=Halalkalicoccus paucihalophilus TaxID=1008153 RepID=A0A151A9Z2_9EURY|nr:hypothetical protein HAPAU_33530 [Halalkalicoccus paucihalophilus]
MGISLDTSAFFNTYGGYRVEFEANWLAQVSTKTYLPTRF